MPPERFPHDDPREWLNRARSNLIQAQDERAGVYLEDLCFQAQQAAEKAFKSVFLHWQIRFPYIHDLAELVNLLEQGGVQVPPEIQAAVGLTDYAVEARYPGTAEPITHEEYRETIDLAEKVVRWAENIVGVKDASSSLQSPETQMGNDNRAPQGS
jgi:HEPN domain-containing protein